MPISFYQKERGLTCKNNNEKHNDVIDCFGNYELTKLVQGKKAIMSIYRDKPVLDLKLKGTNGRQKTYEISHVYSIFYSGFMCPTTVIFGITKDGILY